MIKYLAIVLLLLASGFALAQNKRMTYHPCFLMDSVDVHLNFIKLNAARVFVDSFDCRQTLLDSIASRYIATKNTKYLYALAAIRQNPNAKVEDLYTGIVKRFAENDFRGFITQLYEAKSKLQPLENELIAVMNMIVDGRLLKQKYMGLLNGEIEKAKDAGDKYRQAYFEKLKTRIDEEKYR